MKKHIMLSMSIVGLLAAAAFAGSLNPPAPPTVGTMKPLDQVEPRTPITSVPYTISQSGSYYLIKNLTATGTAITISTDNVTLDLCGFTLTGPGAASGTNYGIYMSDKSNVEIRNGTIKDFGYYGIGDVSNYGTHHSIVNIRVMNNGRCGIFNGGPFTGSDLVKDCQIYYNGTSYTGETYGLYVYSNSLISGNFVYANGIMTSGSAYGIYAGINCKVIDNTVQRNGHTTTGSVYGISVSTGCLVKGNTVYFNGSSSATAVNGIYAGAGSIISGNTVRSNYGYGIGAAASCQIADNNVTSNTKHGISAGNSCIISRNIAESNSSIGIQAGSDCTISGNVANANLADGISAGDHVTITDNTVTGNTDSGIICTGGTITKNTVSQNNTSATITDGGIVVSYHSQVKENTLEGNTKNNIFVTGYRNSIENNVMSGSNYGIYFGSTGNVYLNNRATANGVNYLQAGNTDGGGNISF